MRDRSYTPELIADAIRGDDTALNFLYESTQDKVTQTVRSMIRDEDAVVDIVQDSYIKAFRNLDKLDQPEHYLAWMRRIATNTAVDYMKKKRAVLFSELATEDGTEIEFEDENIGHLPDVLLDQKETSRLIREIVSGLSEEQQLAIGLFYFEDMSIKSIARKLGCSENTVKSRLNYGRKNIEKQVRELEKKGTKLYSLAPLPFFLWLLRNLHTDPSRNVLGTVLAECADLSSGAVATTNYTATEAYQIVLDEYTAAAKAISNDCFDPEQYTYAKDANIDIDSNSATGVHFLYSYRDIDQNGTVELVLGYTYEYGLIALSEDAQILNIYTFDGTQAVPLFPERTSGDSAILKLVNDGELYFEDGRQEGGSYVLARIAPDGYTLEVLYSYRTRLENGQVIYYNDTESYTEFEFRWAFPPIYAVDDIEWTGFTYYSDYWEE